MQRPMSRSTDRYERSHNMSPEPFREHRFDRPIERNLYILESGAGSLREAVAAELFTEPRRNMMADRYVDDNGDVYVDQSRSKEFEAERRGADYLASGGDHYAQHHSSGRGFAEPPPRFIDLRNEERHAPQQRLTITEVFDDDQPAVRKRPRSVTGGYDDFDHGEPYRRQGVVYDRLPSMDRSSQQQSDHYRPRDSHHPFPPPVRQERSPSPPWPGPRQPLQHQRSLQEMGTGGGAYGGSVAAFPNNGGRGFHSVAPKPLPPQMSEAGWRCAACGVDAFSTADDSIVSSGLRQPLDVFLLCLAQKSREVPVTLNASDGCHLSKGSASALASTTQSDAQACQLFLANLPVHFQEGDIRNFLADFDVVSVNIRYPDKPEVYSCYAFATLASPIQVVQAVQRLDGKEVKQKDGAIRKIAVLPQCNKIRSEFGIDQQSPQKNPQDRPRAIPRRQLSEPSLRPAGGVNNFRGNMFSVRSPAANRLGVRRGGFLPLRRYSQGPFRPGASSQRIIRPGTLMTPQYLNRLQKQRQQVDLKPKPLTARPVRRFGLYSQPTAAQNNDVAGGSSVKLIYPEGASAVVVDVNNDGGADSDVEIIDYPEQGVEDLKSLPPTETLVSGRHLREKEQALRSRSARVSSVGPAERSRSRSETEYEDGIARQVPLYHRAGQEDTRSPLHRDDEAPSKRLRPNPRLADAERPPQCNNASFSNDVRANFQLRDSRRGDAGSSSGRRVGFNDAYAAKVEDDERSTYSNSDARRQRAGSVCSDSGRRPSSGMGHTSY